MSSVCNEDVVGRGCSGRVLVGRGGYVVGSVLVGRVGRVCSGESGECV